MARLNPNWVQWLLNGWSWLITDFFQSQSEIILIHEPTLSQAFFGHDNDQLIIKNVQLVAKSKWKSRISLDNPGCPYLHSQPFCMAYTWIKFSHWWLCWDKRFLYNWYRTFSRSCHLRRRQVYNQFIVFPVWFRRWFSGKDLRTVLLQLTWTLLCRINPILTWNSHSRVPLRLGQHRNATVEDELMKQLLLVKPKLVTSAKLAKIPNMLTMLRQKEQKLSQAQLFLPVFCVFILF